MSAHAQPRLTAEEYLALERVAEFRHEFFQGRMYAMAGGTHRHALIMGNLARELGIALKKRPCMVTPSDLRVRVSLDGLYTYPDIAVVCGEPKYADGRKDTLLNPQLLIEVLSPGTEAYDRGFKSAQYRMLESLQEYVLVSQNEARVEIFRRQADGDWLLHEVVGLEAECRFESVECRIALDEIYDKVTFEEPSDAPGGDRAPGI